jgi:hypothetical protein
VSITTWGWGSQGGLVTTLGWGSRVIDTPELKAQLASINEMLATLETNPAGELQATLITATDLLLGEMGATLESVTEIEASLTTENLNDLEATLEEAVLTAVLSNVVVLQATLERTEVLAATLEETGMTATLETTGMKATLESEPELQATLETEECEC